MKLFRNLLIATAAVAVFSGVSAFAEGSDNTDYNKDTNTVTVTANTDAMGPQVTVIVVPSNKTPEEINDGNIYYINQGSQEEMQKLFTGGLGLKALDSEETEYDVLIGGTNSTADTIIRVSFSTKDDTPEEPNPQYGDVNNDTSTDYKDAVEILYYDAFMDSILDDEAEWRFVAGDVTMDDAVDYKDAVEILYYDAFMDSVLDDLLDA